MEYGAEYSLASLQASGVIQERVLDEMMAAEIGILTNEMQAGGPGSGRRKMGLSDKQHASVVALRKQGFRSSAAHSIDGTHAMVRTDDTGKTHVFNLAKNGGFSHSVTTNGAGNKFKTKSWGNHKTIGAYAADSKNVGKSSAFTNAQMARSTKTASAFHTHKAEATAGHNPAASKIHTRAATSFTKASKAFSTGNTMRGNQHYAQAMSHVDSLGDVPTKPKKIKAAADTKKGEFKPIKDHLMHKGWQEHKQASGTYKFTKHKGGTDHKILLKDSGKFIHMVGDHMQNAGKTLDKLKKGFKKVAA